MRPVRDGGTPKRNNLAAIEQPANGEREHRLPVAFARKAVEPHGRFEVVPKPRLLEFRVHFAQIVAFELGLGGDLPAQQSSAKRAIGEHYKPVLLGVRQHVLFDLALE